nr:glycoside hydrolase family 2 TIM barrel-domain containing protein [uncultured Carboxylicivirga sp.]
MKKNIILFTVFSLFLASCYQSAEIQRKQNFDENWSFKLTNDNNASSIDYNDADWRMLNLPHDWSIEGKPEQKNLMSGPGGYFPDGTGWYRKTFDVPVQWKNKKLSIYFEGVYMNAEVFINGHSLGIHPYGYTSFYHDLTPYILYGSSNLIAVRVDNSQQINCRWYSGSGIYRHVWLKVTEPLHIAHWGTTITTPEVNDSKAIVEIKTLVKNETDQAQKIKLVTEIKDRRLIGVNGGSEYVEVPANDEKEVIQQLTVNNPSLWSPKSPTLYTSSTQIKINGESIDEVETQIGIRTIEFSADKGFLLNGESLVLNGGCVHHDNGSLGAAAYDRAEERKVELLKKAGFNAVRTSHNPPSEAFLETCDRLGLLVIDESFDGWRTQKTPHDYASIFDEWWQRDIESMVKRDRNHPSIIMWSVGNEIIERTSPEAVQTAKMLAEEIHKLDPTRPMTSAMTSWGEGWAIFDPLMAEHDVCGYNYMLHEAEKDHERDPERIIFQSESYPKDAFWVWDMSQKHTYIIGDFVWTAMDYLGESGIGRYYYPGEPKGEHWESDLYPWHGAYCGDIDLTGWRKPISHYRNILWNETEKLYLAVKEPHPAEGEIKTTMWAVHPTWESWNWPGFEGKSIDVEVYSKYASVRLYLNDELIGEKTTGIEQQFKATFSVPFSEGNLKAVGIENGMEVESKVIKTAGEVTSIKLIADRSSLKADGQDLSYINVEMVDNDGVLNPTATNHLDFSVTGPGEIIAVDNGDLRDTNSYITPSRKAWNGRAMVVVKSSKKAGKIKLTVSSEGLADSKIEIESK